MATIAAQVDHDELLVPQHGYLIRNRRQNDFESNSFGQLPRRRDQRQGQRFPSNPFLNGQNQGFGNQGFGNQGFGNQGFGGQGSNPLGNPNGNFPTNPFLNNQNNNNGIQDVDDNEDDFSFLNPQNMQTTTTRRNQRITTSTSRPSGGLQVTTPNAVPGAETPRTPCEQRCLTTPQYNPVCGSDGQNYSNEALLNCAIGCGKSKLIMFLKFRLECVSQ